MLKPFPSYYLAGISWLLVIPLSYGQGQALPSLFEVLSSLPEPRLSITLDFDAINQLRKKDSSFVAQLQYQDTQGTPQTWAIKLSVRGRYRRMFCDFPPLKINCSKDDLRARGLSSFDEIKLVTHCFEDNESDEHLFRELLAYHLYQQLTPHSYRTKLLQITYINALQPQQTITRYGFLIEEDAEMAQRMQLKECTSCFVIAQDSLDVQSENRVAAFQYMIGNTDWSIAKGQKNVKYFRPRAGGKMLVVPHDFDFSGFVDAGYAKPASGTNLNNVRERAFLGFKVERRTWETTLQAFQQQRKGFEQIIQAFPHLEPAVKKRIIQYLDSFFEKDASKLIEQYSVN